jgi:CBS domain-containing protein
MRDPVVCEVMTRDVVSVLESASLLEAASTMRARHVSGLPVLDKNGRLAGVVSEKDIARVLRQTAGLGSARSLLEIVLRTATGQAKRGESKLRACAQRLKRVRVSEAMARNPVTATPATTLYEAGRLMRERRVNRLPVVEGGEVEGIVTRQDVVAGLAKNL